MLGIRSKKWVCCISRVLLIMFCSLLVYTPVAAAAVADDIQNSMDKLLGYYNRVAQYDDWETLGLRWAGVECSSKYTTPEEEPASASDYARIILGSIAARQDEAVVSNYVYKLVEMQHSDGDAKGSFINGDNAGLNQTIWAVIALGFAQSNGITIPEKYNRNDAVDYICSQQDNSGGFDESGWGVDVDSTAHALIALAADKDAKAETIDRALGYLREQQMDSGGFGGWGSESPDSTAAVIEALIALKTDLLADEWIKNGKNMVDALLAYQSDQGWFVYSWEPADWNDPTVPNRMASYHSLLALGDLVQEKSKYYSDFRELPATNGLCFTVQSANSFNLGNDADMSFRLNNNGNSPVDVLIAAGLFDTSNEHQLILTSLSKKLLAEESVGFGSSFTLPASGSYEVRVFVWDNWSTKNPLLVPSVIPVQ